MTTRYFQLDTGGNGIALARITTDELGLRAEAYNASTGGEWVAMPSLRRLVMSDDNLDGEEISGPRAQELTQSVVKSATIKT